MHLTLNIAQVQVPQSNGDPVMREVKGPFTFDFTLPVDPLRRIADLNQVVTTANGDKITLTRVIATRHHVRVLWRLGKSSGWERPHATEVPEFALLGWYTCCYLRLEVGGKSAYFKKAEGPSTSQDDVATASVLAEQGDWTISAWYYSTWTGGRIEPDARGAVFRFTMPPAIESLQP
ncbi:MAG TPA: hypothetical protein VF952_05955 [Chloroflexia bacterium]